MRPRKAFVLAAGHGVRMRPLSLDLPKPLMPLWGRPLLEHVLRLLRDWGVRDVLVNAHHGADRLIAYVARRPAAGLRLSVSFEPMLLGTGGALQRASWFFDDLPFWLINSDIAADLSPRRLIAAFQRHNPLAVVWLDPARGPRTVELDGEFVCGFRAEPASNMPRLTLCGVHLLTRRILRYLPHEGPADLIAAYEAALKAGERIVGVCVPRSFWADLGTPERYLDAHAEVQRAARTRQPGARLFGRTSRPRRVFVQGFAAISPTAVVRPGARLRNSVVWDFAELGPRTRATNAIIGCFASMDGAASGPVGRGDRFLDSAEQSVLREFGWAPEKALVYALSPRGSARRFLRIRHGNESVILMHYDPARAENTLYVPIARFLRSIRFPVPRVLHDRSDRCCAILEDVGEESLRERIARLPSDAIERLYQRVLRHVARLHDAKKEPERTMPPFDVELFRWEHDLFLQRAPGAGVELSRRMRACIRAELQKVAQKLSGARWVLLHRDLQSDNILLRNGRPVFIDFQGLRRGPAVYDLASLLCDPYVSLPQSLQVRLLDFYLTCRRDPSVRPLFWWAAVQRLVQALGAYGRLLSLGLKEFGAHVLPALYMLQRALRHVDEMPALNAWVSARIDSRRNLRQGTEFAEHAARARQV